MFNITGKIVKGLGLGKKLGFPTINIPYNAKKRGVFAAKVLISEASNSKVMEFAAAVNLGERPTIGDNRPICEAFLLNFNEASNGGIVGNEQIEVRILKKIRDIKKCPNLKVLKLQIEKDVEKVRSFFELK